MINDLTLIRDFLFTIWDQLILLYFGGGILSFAFGIYLIRKVSTLIDKLR